MFGLTSVIFKNRKKLMGNFYLEFINNVYSIGHIIYGLTLSKLKLIRSNKAFYELIFWPKHIYISC